MNKKAKNMLAPGIYFLQVPITTIPVVGGVINEIINAVQKTMLDRRLNHIDSVISEKLSIQGISINDFIDLLHNCNEQEYYVLRNTFKHVVLSAEPEVVEPLCKAMVAYALKEEQDINQIVCEAFSELNSSDIKLLSNIKKFLDTEEYKEELQKTKDKAGSAKQNNDFQERNIFYDNRTIKWRHFGIKLKTDEKDYVFPAYLALNGTFISNDKENYFLALEVLSILKMERLGIVETEHVTTMGTTSQLSIERFHITILGEKILNFI